MSANSTVYEHERPAAAQYAVKMNDRATRPNSKTIAWRGIIATSAQKSPLTSFTVTFETDEAPTTLPNCLLQPRLMIVGRTCVSKVDNFTNNKDRRIHIYGLNIVNNKETYEDLLPQYIQNQTVGVINTPTGHAYIVPRALQNKISLLKDKKFSTIAIVLVVKSLKKNNAIVKQKSSVEHLFSALAHYRGPTPVQQQSQYPPQYPPQYQSQYQYPPQYPPQYQYQYPPQYRQNPVHQYTPVVPQSYVAVKQSYIPH